MFEFFKRNEKSSNLEGLGKKLSRREFLMGAGSSIAFMLCPNLREALAQDSGESLYENGWFYSSEEMRALYEQEYNGDKVLKNVVRKEGERYVGMFEGKDFVIPKEFIETLLTHFKEMIEKQTARYLFRLDAYHGHLFTSADYASLGASEQMKRMPNDHTLGVLYHNSEHVKLEGADQETVTIFSLRNVIGTFDGNPIEILPLPEGKLKGVEIPKGASNLKPFLKFAAHKDGAFSIILFGKEVHLDISFDDSSYY